MVVVTIIIENLEDSYCAEYDSYGGEDSYGNPYNSYGGYDP